MQHHARLRPPPRYPASPPSTQRQTETETETGRRRRGCRTACVSSLCRQTPAPSRQDFHQPTDRLSTPHPSRTRVRPSVRLTDRPPHRARTDVLNGLHVATPNTNFSAFVRALSIVCLVSRASRKNRLMVETGECCWTGRSVAIDGCRPRLWTDAGKEDKTDAKKDGREDARKRTGNLLVKTQSGQTPGKWSREYAKNQSEKLLELKSPQHTTGNTYA